MTRKLMWSAEAVKAYESGQGVKLVNTPHPHYEPLPEDLKPESLEVVELELPDEDEAVGWADGGVINWIAGKQFKHASYLYTTPPKRTWVGLTKEERHEISMANRPYCADVMAAHEEELKRRNT